MFSCDCNWLQCQPLFYGFGWILGLHLRKEVGMQKIKLLHGTGSRLGQILYSSEAMDGLMTCIRGDCNYESWLLATWENPFQNHSD